MILNRVIFVSLLAIVVPEILGLFTRNIKERFKKQLHIHDHHHHHHHHHNKHLQQNDNIRGPNRHRESHTVSGNDFLTDRPKTLSPLSRPRTIPSIHKPKSTTTTTVPTTTTQETTTFPTTTTSYTTETTTTEITTTELPKTEKTHEETTVSTQNKPNSGEILNEKRLKQVYVVNKNLKQELRKGFLNTPTPPRKPMRFITTEKPMSTSRKPHKYQIQTKVPIIYGTTRKPSIHHDPFAKSKIVSTSIINYFNTPKKEPNVKPKYHDYYKNVEPNVINDDNYKNIRQTTANYDDHYGNIDEDRNRPNYDDYYKNFGDGDHYNYRDNDGNSELSQYGDDHKHTLLHYDDYKNSEHGINHPETNIYDNYGYVNNQWNGDNKDTPKIKKSKIKYTINYDNYENDKKYGSHFNYPPPTDHFVEKQNHLHLHRHKHGGEEEGESKKLFGALRNYNSDKTDSSYSASYFKLWS